MTRYDPLVYCITKAIIAGDEAKAVELLAAPAFLMMCGELGIDPLEAERRIRRNVSLANPLAPGEDHTCDDGH